jgi:hypothetical protein
VAARNDRGRGPPPGRGPPGPMPGYAPEPPRRPSVDHLRRDELPTAPMKAALGARTSSTELSLRPGGLGGPKGASPMRGAGERRLAPGAGVASRMGMLEQPPPPARPQPPPPPQQQQQQQQPAPPAPRQGQRSSEDDASAPGSGRPSEEVGGSGGGAGGAAAGAMSDAEVSGAVDSVVKLLFGQADDTGEAPEDLLAAVVAGAGDVGAALQELLRRALDVRGAPLEERFDKPKARGAGAGALLAWGFSQACTHPLA